MGRGGGGGGWGVGFLEVSGFLGDHNGGFGGLWGFYRGSSVFRIAFQGKRG